MFVLWISEGKFQLLQSQNIKILVVFANIVQTKNILKVYTFISTSLRKYSVGNDFSHQASSIAMHKNRWNTSHKAGARRIRTCKFVIFASKI